MNDKKIRTQHPVRRLAVAMAVVVATLGLGAVRATPAGADSLGNSVIWLFASTSNGTFLSPGSSVPYGTGVNFVAQVRDISSSCSPVKFSCDAPAGTVEMVDNDVVLATGQLQPVDDESSQVGFELGGGPVADLDAGLHQFSFRYSGNFDPEVSGFNLIVNPINCTLTISQSSAVSNAGEPVEFIGDLGSIGHSGSMWFEDPLQRVIGVGQMFFGAVGKITTTALPPGFTDVRAVYGGDPNHHSCASGFLRHTVQTTVTSTSLTSSPNPSTIGGFPTFTATVTGGSSTPTGSVRFRDGANTFALIGLVNGVASFSSGALGVGGHTISADYLGDSTHAPSSISITHIVLAPTTIQIAVPDTPSVVGVPLVYTAAVSPPDASGTVLFQDGTTPIAGCSARPLVDGEATCTVTWPAPGDHELVAAFSGDAAYAPSESAPRAVSVAKAPTQLTAAPATYVGRNTSVTVSARSTHALTGTPIGGQRVEFYAGTKLLCATLTDANGVAQCSGGKIAVAALRSRGSYQAWSVETPTHLGASTSASA
jgi:hypothetical protein